MADPLQMIPLRLGQFDFTTEVVPNFDIAILDEFDCGTTPLRAAVKSEGSLGFHISSFLVR
jgi:hypothetical protein